MCEEVFLLEFVETTEFIQTDGKNLLLYFAVSLISSKVLLCAGLFFSI